MTGMRVCFGILLGYLLAGCGGGGPSPCLDLMLPGLGGGSGCVSSPPPPCGSIRWVVTTAPEFPAGESRVFTLKSPDVLHPLEHCAGRVRSIAWDVSDASVAVVTPETGDLTRAWVTGMSPGRTPVHARVHFVDGSERISGLSEARIGPRRSEAPGTRLIASSRLDLPGTAPRCTAASSSCALHLIDLPAAGRVDIAADWESPVNRVPFQLLAGHCGAGPATCGARIIDVSVAAPTAKPTRASRPDLAAGPYTLVVFNRGPGPEVARYEVWLTP